LTETPGEHRYVVTVPGRGYQFVADVRRHDVEQKQEAEEETVRGLAETRAGPARPWRSEEALTNDASHTHTLSSAEYIGGEIKRHKLLLLATLLATTIVLSYLAFSRYFAVPRPPGITSMAVLPFANNTGDPNEEYLSDGISESLINSLSELRGVKVIASNSSFQYKDKKVNFQNVAAALAVDEIVTGRVLQRGETLIISVELVNGRDGTHLWGEQYARKVTDVLQLQSEIAGEITEQLRSRLTASERQQLARRVSVNPQAYELLLKGRFHWRKGGLENQKKAVEYYQQAISADPTYALAYAELSASYIFLYGSGLLDPKEFRPRAEAAAYKALELDEGLADAHYALAGLKQNDWQWAAAEREFRRALQLNPNLAEAHHYYSFYLMDTGRYDEAVDEAKRARELDPLSLERSARVVDCLVVARRHDEAIELSLKTLEMDQSSAPAHFSVAFAYAGKGRYREAINEYQEAIKLAGDSPTDQIYLGALYAKAGERKKAQEMLKRLETSKEYVSPGELTVLYAALGEREQAFASLEKAYAAHDLQLQYLRADPFFDSLRDDSRFKDLMRRVGLS
jgi:TolB-like protein/Tfp pilus assembly protein PilF